MNCDDSSKGVVKYLEELKHYNIFYFLGAFTNTNLSLRFLNPQKDQIFSNVSYFIYNTDSFIPGLIN